MAQITRKKLCNPRNLRGSSSCLIVGVTGGDLDHASIRQTTAFRKPSGLPFRAGMNFTLMLSPAWSAFGPVVPIPPLGERRSGAERHHPWGCRRFRFLIK